jgi:hypothetical protein
LRAAVAFKTFAQNSTTMGRAATTGEMMARARRRGSLAVVAVVMM